MILENIAKEETEKLKKHFYEINLENDDIYAEYLAQTYYYVKHSVKLLALSVAHFKTCDKRLEQRFIKHISEENNHEIDLVNDLRSLGYSINNYPEKHQTMALWEPQYTKVEKHDPAELLGYIAMLEYTAANLATIFIEKRKHNSKGLKFLSLHSDEDDDHVEKAFKAIYELSEDRQERIKQNMLQTYRAYTEFITAISETASFANVA